MVLPGHSSPLGATPDTGGTNFALYSENASGVELCLFDQHGSETARHRLTEVTAHVWHGYRPGIGPGQRYGYRVHGPYEPDRGLRFNSNKLLLDPYARAIDGAVDWQQPVFGYEVLHADADLSFDEGDSATGAPKGIVVQSAFDWEDDRPPQVLWHHTVIYEAHVKGMTMRHPDVPEELRGTYAGLGHPAVVEHLQRLGVTAIELMPIHAFLDDGHLIDRGLRNYWGYSTINFFAPESRFSSRPPGTDQIDEVKGMIKALHGAGIEVILDVVYNHTAEGSERGPTLSFRGIDNPTYYRLVPDDERFHFDYTGTGNTLNVRHPAVLRLIMDSLRYWVTEMHIDGFRFDLAAALAREFHDVDRLSGFFDVIYQDPVISRVKLIAEPWDVGEGGYQVGNFPELWTEWNGKYRDTVRAFWKGDAGTAAELGYRLTGSSDLYAEDGRRPYASINFVTAHDGFTLLDLVSYNEKHNDANLEENRDGHDDNLSWNCGVEGPTDDDAVLDLRFRQMRNFLATLLFSQGVPMLGHGDEVARSQAGNNNAYCQDNELSWVDWELDERRRSLLELVGHIVALRHRHPNLRRRKYFFGRPIHGSEIKDITWLRPDGQEMSDEDWDAGWLRCFGVRLGDVLGEVNENGEVVTDDALLLLLNAHHEPLPFLIPSDLPGTWEVEVDTAAPDGRGTSRHCDAGETFEISDRSLVLLRLAATPPVQ
jgi:glycogen operon protein